MVSTSGSEIHAGPDGALMEIGAPTRTTRRKTRHGHHGDASIDHESHVWNAVAGDRLELWMDEKALLHKGYVWLSTEGIES